MQTLDPKTDCRAINDDQWSRLRYLQDRARQGKINMTLLADEFSDALLMLFREVKRLRSEADNNLLQGFNQGYDQCLIDFGLNGHEKDD